MSDFLFRMIERASGRSSVHVPQPPLQYQWPALLDRPAPVPVAGSPAVPVLKPEPVMSLPLATLHSFGNSVDVLDPPIAPQSLKPQSPGELMNTELTPDAKRRSHFAHTAIMKTSPTARLGEHLPIQSAEVASIDFSEATRPSLPMQPEPESKTQVHYREAEDRASLPEPNAMIAEQRPASSARLVAASLAIQQEHGPAQSSPAPTLAQPARSNNALRSISHAPQETADPVVEVNIARVEVRLDAPKQPAPQPVSRPRGFAEYESLRRYITSPWARRR